ncbi:MAG: DUF1289 domain-containing protein [Aeromonadales bacterium]|nr:DUF1289 domain-containing protein [Aeromonadales bacterium]
MEQLEFFAVLSPCIGVCQVNNKGYCKGCFRNRDERFNWLTFNVSQQQEVLRLCQDRKRRVLAAARKRARDAATTNDLQQQLPF